MPAVRKAVQGDMIALGMAECQLLRHCGVRVGVLWRGRVKARVWDPFEGTRLPKAAAPHAAPRSVLRAAFQAGDAGPADGFRGPVCRRSQTAPGVASVVALTCRSAPHDPPRFR